MPYLIDGHNLIPKVPGLSLRAMDDEMQLIQVLQDFCRQQRKQVEVYFDRAPHGQPRTRKFGAVMAHFIRQGTTADDAIAVRLQNLGATARNWTVVSSDQQVQVSARRAGAQVLDSGAFARQLAQPPDKPATRGKGATRGPMLTPTELDEWMRLFGVEEDDDQE